MYQAQELLKIVEAWTTTPKIEKELDGFYTRMLRTVLDVRLKKHMTNDELYGNLPKSIKTAINAGP